MKWQILTFCDLSRETLSASETGNLTTFAISGFNFPIFKNLTFWRIHPMTLTISLPLKLVLIAVILAIPGALILTLIADKLWALWHARTYLQLYAGARSMGFSPIDAHLLAERFREKF